MNAQDLLVGSLVSIVGNIVSGVISVMYEYRYEARREQSVEESVAESAESYFQLKKLKNPSKLFRWFVPITVVIIFINILFVILLSANSIENKSLQISITFAGILYLFLTNYQLTDLKPEFVNYIKVALTPASLLMIWSMNYFESAFISFLIISALVLLYETHVVKLDRNLALGTKIIIVPFSTIFITTITEVNVILAFILSIFVWVVLFMFRYADENGDNLFHDIHIFNKNDDGQTKGLLAEVGEGIKSKSTNWLFLLAPLLVFISYTIYLFAEGTPTSIREHNEYMNKYGYKITSDTAVVSQPIGFGWSKTIIRKWTIETQFPDEVILENEDGIKADKMYEEVRNFSKIYGLAAVKYNGYYGFIDTTGAEIIPCKYEEVGGFSSKGLSWVVISREIKKDEYKFDTLIIDLDGRVVRKFTN